jgi:GT2 family glycosyltransferase
MIPRPVLSISIVSHGQGALISALLNDIAAHCTLPLEVILTLNIPEANPPEIRSWPFPVKITENPGPKGFAANHNAAYAQIESEYFCILNPDVRIETDPFPELIKLLRDPKIGIAGPLIFNTSGQLEDSARRFPTLGGIFRKAIFGRPDPQYPRELIYPDWIAGMFMICRREVFRDVEGFDEGYFLYYEDVDFCWRVRSKGLQVVQSPLVSAIHDARRASHHNLRYLVWHCKSMARFFIKTALKKQ